MCHACQPHKSTSIHVCVYVYMHMTDDAGVTTVAKKSKNVTWMSAAQLNFYICVYVYMHMTDDEGVSTVAKKKLSMYICICMCVG